MTIENEIVESATRFVLDQFDLQNGGFVFAPGNAPTLMGTAYAIHALEFIGGLDRLQPQEKKAIIDFLLLGCQADGSFRDALFRSDMISTDQHDEAYFDGETTCFCQNALDALESSPPPRRRFPENWLNIDSLRQEFDSYDWRDPHLNSNRVMFVLSQFAHEIERHNRTDLIPLLDGALDWIDENQSPVTGLWKGPYNTALSAAMAATFHYTFFYFFRNRPLLFPERIIDSCIDLQREDGLFSRNNDIGQTCLDYDALDLLAKCTLMTDYRKADIGDVFARADRALLDLRNTDGGFANVRNRLAGRKIVSATGLYHTGLQICSCDNTESNLFSTWFRCLGLALCRQGNWLGNENILSPINFRRLPWLGYHNFRKIQEVASANDENTYSINLKNGGGPVKTLYQSLDLNVTGSSQKLFIFFPDDVRRFSLCLEIENENTLYLKTSIRNRQTLQYQGEGSLSQIVKPGNSAVYFVMGDQHYTNPLLVECFGENMNGKIRNVSARLF